MSKDEDIIEWCLTEDGWDQYDVDPSKVLATINFHSPEKMYQRGYWGDLHIKGDRDKADAAMKKFGHRPGMRRR